MLPSSIALVLILRFYDAAGVSTREAADAETAVSGILAQAVITEPVVEWPTPTQPPCPRRLTCVEGSLP